MEKEFNLSTRWIQEYYNIFNNEIFGGELPSIAFGISSASKHAGFARCRRNPILQTITPLKILLSTYLNPTERIAINTLLHEMIHIADYTLHPEHFFDEYYDSHKSDFFQGWMKRINDMGYWVTETTTKKELEDVKSASIKKNNDKKAIAILAKWYGDSGRYDIAWTENKFMPDVVCKNSYTHYQSITFCNIADNNMLTAKECKGKMMRGNIIEDGVEKNMLQKYSGQIIFPGFKKVDVSHRIISYKEKETLINNSYAFTEQIIERIQKIFDNCEMQRYTNRNGLFSASSDISYIDGKRYWVSVSERLKDVSHTSVDILRGIITVNIPIRKDTMEKLREEYNKRIEGQVYFQSRFEGDIEQEIEEGLMNIITAEQMIRENKNNKPNIELVVEETIKEFVDKITASTDKSIVDVKELEDGSVIVTQW